MRVVKVQPAHTSDGCRVCGHEAAENRESQAVFRCLNCGHTGHADLEAAHNILARALGLAPTPGHGGKEANQLLARVRRRSWRGGNSREELADAA